MSSSETQQENDNPFVAPDTTDDPPYETPEPEPFAPEPDAEPEPEPAPQGPTPEQIEALQAKAAKLTNTYMGKVGALLQEADQQVMECPLCLEHARGWVLIGQRGHYTHEFVARVNEFLTGVGQVEYQQLPGFTTCQVCGGEGKGYTGSQVPEYRFTTCPACRGRGYLAPALEQANGSAPEAAQYLAAPDDAPYSSDADVDPWGEPKTLPDGRDNPNYGKMPNFKVSVEPYGNTAALTQQAGV